MVNSKILTDRQTDRAWLILNPVSRMPWRYVKTANDDGKGTGGRRDERVATNSKKNNIGRNESY